jgi:nitrate reductase delta subunit
VIELVRTDTADLGLIADLFEYPGSDFAASAERAAREARTPAVALHLQQFASEIAALRPELVEEAHVRTFLVAPSTAPYVGVHLFGEESFKRAHLMSQLVERFRALGFEAGNELPDHIGVLLRFARCLDAEELADLVRWCLAMPVTEMHKVLATTHNPYRHLLAALAAAVAPDGLPEDVRLSITRSAATPDPEGCQGCSIKHGGEEL